MHLLDNSASPTGLVFLLTSSQQAPHIALVHLFQHVLRQCQPVQERCRLPLRLGSVVRIGNRTAASPVAFPERPLTPVTADVVLASGRSWRVTRSEPNRKRSG